jgi:thiol peroxidase
MAAGKGGKIKKKVKREAKKVIAKALSAKTDLIKKIEAKTKEKILQKDTLIKKLKEELTQRKKMLAETKKNLVQKGKEELAAFKEKAEAKAKELKQEIDEKRKAFQELQKKTEVEIKKLKEEAAAKAQALTGKIAELESYKKSAEKKISELEAKAKEYMAKIKPAEKERTGLITSKGNPLTLLGEEVKVGDKAPDFKVLDNSMQPVSLADFRGKVKIITSVPSLDTPVCNMEIRRFNEEAGKLPDKVVVLTISMDLPFAQARWYAAAGVEKVKTFSDYRERSFGLAYGVLIKELLLLARAVFIVDDQDIIRYVELVPEITQEPEYARVFNAVQALL